MHAWCRAVQCKAASAGFPRVALVLQVLEHDLLPFTRDWLCLRELDFGRTNTVNETTVLDICHRFGSALTNLDLGLACDAITPRRAMLSQFLAVFNSRGLRPQQSMAASVTAALAARPYCQKPYFSLVGQPGCSCAPKSEAIASASVSTH